MGNSRRIGPLAAALHVGKLITQARNAALREALRKRLLDKFTETVTAIDATGAAIAKAESALAAAQNELASYVAGLTL